MNVGQRVRLVGPFESDMPEYSLETTVKAVHDDGTVDIDMTPFGLTYKTVPFVTDGAAPSTAFCEPLDAECKWREA